MTYCRASLINLYLRTKFHLNWRKFLWIDVYTDGQTNRLALLGRLGGIHLKIHSKTFTRHQADSGKGCVYACISVYIVLISSNLKRFPHDSIWNWLYRVKHLKQVDETKADRETDVITVTDQVRRWRPLVSNDCAAETKETRFLIFDVVTCRLQRKTHLVTCTTRGNTQLNTCTKSGTNTEFSTPLWG